MSKLCSPSSIKQVENSRVGHIVAISKDIYILGYFNSQKHQKLFCMQKLVNFDNFEYRKAPYFISVNALLSHFETQFEMQFNAAKRSQSLEQDELLNGTSS